MANGTNGTNGTAKVAILAVALIAVVMVGAVVALAVFAPDNSLSIIVPLLAAIAPTVAALLAWLQSKETAKKQEELKVDVVATAQKVETVTDVASILATETKDLHTTVNSNLTKFIDVEKALSAALATIAEQKAQHAREQASLAASDTTTTTTTVSTLASPAIVNGAPSVPPLEAATELSDVPITSSETPQDVALSGELTIGHSDSAKVKLNKGKE